MKRDKVEQAKPVDGKAVSPKELQELVTMLRNVPHDHDHHHGGHHGSKSDKDRYH